MESFVTSTVFNPKLTGKAVRIIGYDVDGNKYNRVFLVKETTGEHITLVNCQGELIEDLHLENFTYGSGALKIIYTLGIPNE